MADVISTEELKAKIDGGAADFILVDVLSENSFDGRHIQGAVNVPNGSDFIADFEKKVGASKDTEIITYCASATCMASVKAANALEEAGYTNVKHYKDGLAGWQEAGYKIEGGV